MYFVVLNTTEPIHLWKGWNEGDDPSTYNLVGDRLQVLDVFVTYSWHYSLLKGRLSVQLSVSIPSQ